MVVDKSYPQDLLLKSMEKDNICFISGLRMMLTVADAEFFRAGAILVGQPVQHSSTQLPRLQMNISAPKQREERKS